MKRIACLSLALLSLVACNKDDEYRSVELDLKTVRLDIADCPGYDGHGTHCSGGDIAFIG